MHTITTQDAGRFPKQLRVFSFLREMKVHSKAMMLLFMFAASSSSCIAQYAQEEGTKEPFKSYLQQEFTNLERNIDDGRPIQVDFSIKELSSHNLVSGIDFIDSDSIHSIYKHNSTHGTAPIDQALYINEVRFDKEGMIQYKKQEIPEININNQTFSNVSSIMSEEVYSLTSETLRFSYSNKHHYFYDFNGSFIASISLIRRTTGLLNTEDKVIKLSKTLLEKIQTVSSGKYRQHVSPNNLSVSPNPSSLSVNITVSVSTETTGSMRLINPQGQVVKDIFANQRLSAGNHSYGIDISEFSPGIYTVMFVTNDDLLQARLSIINH